MNTNLSFLHIRIGRDSISWLLAGFISLLPAVCLAASPGSLAVSVQTGVRVKMRDGISLVADIYRPAAPGKYPVLLQRTPYNRTAGAADAHLMASHGYVVILQDTRGRFDSEGEFYPFRHETEDGYDTVEWAAALEYANGKVGMFGASYVGATQMLAAISKPPHLTAIFPYVTASEYYDGWTYQSGALMQWFASSWTSGLTIDTLRRKANLRLRPKEWVESFPVEDYRLLDLPTASELAPYLMDWVTHETEDEYWKRWKISDHYPEMTVKGLHAGGWHDIFVKGSIKNFTGLRGSARSAEVRDGQRLLVGPWAHAATSSEGKVGDVVFGKEAVLDMPQTTLDWFDYALRGNNNRFASGKRVRLFILGENVWRDEDEFPLKRARQTRYFLRSERGANSGRGDGKLALEAPRTEAQDTFLYDPLNPVPTLGGRLCCGAAIAPGPFDQKSNESRTDVLVYSTPPLEKDTEVTGYITLDLFAASSASDTDFTAIVADVDPAGYARYLTDGIVRARYRNSTEKPEPIVPGQVYKYTLDLWATGNLFKASHQIRLYVSSSNFPRFNRNLNTGEATLGSTKSLVAKQTIYHDAQHPSALVLPVIPP
ncbi:MAG TPA: CocE/NonD family hydrolase [Terriglobia bacterium]|nr:CocE/NonD family hydrolase [Terriglobia bacterium]